MSYTLAMSNEPVLYLDYDGVLHPADVRVTQDEPHRPLVYIRGQPSSHPLFEHANLLESLLEPHPTLRIILSTSWVREFGYEFALQQLPPSLQSRVIGATWRTGMRVQPPARYYCIQIDAEERGLERWLAVDDDLYCWPDNELYRVVAPTGPLLGLAEPGIADELEQKLRWLCT
jgi:hypothetical protein